jgi:hypothetical protein
MYFFSSFLTIAALCGFASCKAAIDKQQQQDDDSRMVFVLRWASVCVACLLVFAVQLGVQTLPFLLSGELFANDVRAVCKGKEENGQEIHRLAFLNNGSTYALKRTKSRITIYKSVIFDQLSELA